MPYIRSVPSVHNLVNYFTKKECQEIGHDSTDVQNNIFFHGEQKGLSLENYPYNIFNER